MTGVSYALRGLWFFRKSYAGVLAGSALGAMVLSGALMTGDSVKATLLHLAEARIGTIDSVLIGNDRLFRAALADDMSVAGVNAAPALYLKATATAQHSGRAMGNVQVIGVDARFWKFAPGSGNTPPPQGREFFVNEHLAQSLALGSNDTLVLRFEKPAMIARDAPLAGKAAELIALRGNIRRTCGDAEFGRFSLETTQLPQSTVFVPIQRLQELIGFPDKANLLLLHNSKERDHRISLDLVGSRCKLEDYGLSVTDVPLARAVEIRTARIFFDRQVASAVQTHFPTAQPVITYMANTIAAKGKQTPYSMVTAGGPKAVPYLNEHSNGVVLNSWEAEDLGATVGDEVSIDYYALESGNHLVERSVRLPVEGVIPLTGLAADQMWMPDFPGVAAAEKTSDWDPGVPIDLKRIRDKDEAYWSAHRGTPKLFLPLAKGRELFGNRWGEFTALRVPAANTTKEEIGKELLGSITPGLAGLTLRDFNSQGFAAASSPVDFAGLFLGMSLFLMAAAVALTAMLFRLHIEQRNRESGLLAALGIPAVKVLRWRLLEGLYIVMVGGGIGVLLAAGYTRLLLRFLETIWSGSGGGRMFRFNADPVTTLTGIMLFIFLMMTVILLVTRKQAQQGVSLRLEAGTEEVTGSSLTQPWPGHSHWPLIGLAAALLTALAAHRSLGDPLAFFLAGFIFLVAGMTVYQWLLRRRMAAPVAELSPKRLAQLNCGRRATRSMVVVGTLASGVFLVVSVAAFRKHDGDEWKRRDSGAGGFAYWVETTYPANRDHKNKTADDPAGLGEVREHFGEVLPMRIGAGDDASCFNLNKVTRPRLLATDMAELSHLGAFSIKSVITDCNRDWNILREGEVLRAFVDETTLLWVMKKHLGDRISYQDEWGQDFLVEIAGTLDDSIFQGSMVVDETRFLQHYPSAEGARLFLIDDSKAIGTELAILQKSLADQGAVVTTTHERLEAFHGVENTYIMIFNVLGGLGIVVGSAGLGLVTARNLLERRHEFAILHTLGIPAEVIRHVVLLEVAQFIHWGLGIGVAAALVAILPLSSAGGIRNPFVLVALLVLLVATNAWFASWLAFRLQIHTTLNTRQEFG